MHDAAVDLAHVRALSTGISIAHTILAFAEVQHLMGNGHQPLQHEAAQDEDLSSTSGEEDSAIGPGQSKASASSDPASASGESTDPKNQALREGNIKSPEGQFRLLPRNHWVIYRRGCERNWVIELRSNFQKKDREQCMKKAHPLTRFRCNTEKLC